MAVLSVETKKISELDAATTLGNDALFVADIPGTGTQKITYGNLIANTKTSLGLGAEDSILPASAIAASYTSESGKVAPASQAYDLNNRLNVIERENECIAGARLYGIEWALADLLTEIRASRFNSFAIGDYILANSKHWCIVAKNFYCNSSNIANPSSHPHAVLMPYESLGSYAYNSTNTNSGGYEGSELKTTIEGTVFNGLPSALRSACLEIKQYESTKASYGSKTRKIRLPNEIQVMGYRLYAPANGCATQQLPLCRSLRFMASDTWVVDPSDSNTTGFLAYSYTSQRTQNYNASTSKAIRPIIVIG